MMNDKFKGPLMSGHGIRPRRIRDNHTGTHRDRMQSSKYAIF